MTTAPTPVRDTILITHANPEDNRFARWLAGRLTTAGYKVWVDVRALRGGDDFWDKIEHVLRHEAIKQIVVVSEHIGKQGVKKELALGDVMRRKLSDAEFMIPIRIADVDFGDFPTEILRQNAHNAFPNWAACLQPLFETLDTSRVPKVEHPDAEQLAMIVAAQEDGRKLVTLNSETLYSNWFELRARPDVWILEAKGTTAQLEAWSQFTKVPHVLHEGGAREVVEALGVVEHDLGFQRLEEGEVFAQARRDAGPPQLREEPGEHQTRPSELAAMTARTAARVRTMPWIAA